MILGNLGAEVIKIEHHENGDETRGRGPPFVNGESAYYLCANRNKESITINLKSEQGKEIFRQLVSTGDVVVQNFVKTFQWNVKVLNTDLLLYVLAAVKGLRQLLRTANCRKGEESEWLII